MPSIIDNLSEPSLLILDCVSHTPVYGFEDLRETLALLGMEDISVHEKAWEKLVQDSILVQKNTAWVVNDSAMNVIRTPIASYLGGLNVTLETVKDSLAGELEAQSDKLAMLIRAMGRLYEKSIIFTDYDWDNTLMAFCDTLPFFTCPLFTLLIRKIAN